MANNIEVTYTRQHTISLSEARQDYIAQEIYDAFIEELSDYVDDGTVEHVPGNVLKQIFVSIVENMKTDNEFWRD